MCPLSFFSWVLKPTEKRYSTYDCELLDIFLCIQHFHYFLEMRDLPNLIVTHLNRSAIWTTFHSSLLTYAMFKVQQTQQQILSLISVPMPSTLSSHRFLGAGTGTSGWPLFGLHTDSLTADSSLRLKQVPLTLSYGMSVCDVPSAFHHPCCTLCHTMAYMRLGD